MKKALKSILTGIIAIYLGFGFLLFARQDDYIYYPSNQDFNACEGFSDSEKLNLNGTRAYYKKISDKLVVFYHGNGGSACEMSFLKDTFTGLGYSYIFVEYAGYSNDGKKASQELIMKDVENVNNFLKTLDYQKLAIVGESLGASLALYHSSMADEDKLLLIAPFYSLGGAASIHYPVYPVSLLLRDKYKSYLWTGDIKDVEIIHGTKDTIVPITESKKLFDKINVNNKKFVEVSGADHNDIYDYSETWLGITDFLK
ncbi:alpha/beta hydrolase [Candidatus Uhrbacteria bacterium]|nr:alpha/beta hydrolase [Candidatus Uhrbacteria bacterium]